MFRLLKAINKCTYVVNSKLGASQIYIKLLRLIR